MSTRYTRLFSLPENLYAEGMPVIIAAGALLKDEQTGNVLAQLKFKSISTKGIKALKVCISPLDTADNPLGEPTHFQYLDLTVSRDQTFGDKTPVFLPDATTRAFTVYVEAVIFQDNSVWNTGAQALNTLHAPTPLSSISDLELVRQFRMEYGDGCKNLPLDDKDLWHCVCGAVNHREEAACRMCGNLHATLQAISMDDLRKRKDERLAHEQKLALEEAERQKAAAKAAAKKAGKIAIPLAAVLAVILLVTQVIVPASRYNKAADLMAQGLYDEAASAYEAMGDYKDAPELKNEAVYQSALSLIEIGEYEEAATILEALGDYSDAPEHLTECNNTLAYAEAEELESSGETAKAAIAFGKLGDYKDAHERSFGLWDKVANRETISAGIYSTIGLKSDGTVIATGNNNYGQCDVEHMNGIVAVSAGQAFTVGLKDDGTVIAVGTYDAVGCNVENWTDIVAVSACNGHNVGLKSDGTVVANGWNKYGQCDVSGWKDIIAISAGYYHTVGLKADGTVVAVGNNDWGQCDVEHMNGIVAVSAGQAFTVGLKDDGTVIAVGADDAGICNVENWTDIVAVSACNGHNVGLKSDGTVVANGWNMYGQCDVSDWTDIKIPN